MKIPRPTTSNKKITSIIGKLLPVGSISSFPRHWWKNIWCSPRRWAAWVSSVWSVNIGRSSSAPWFYPAFGLTYCTSVSCWSTGLCSCSSCHVGVSQFYCEFVWKINCRNYIFFTGIGRKLPDPDRVRLIISVTTFCIEFLLQFLILRLLGLRTNYCRPSIFNFRIVCCRIFVVENSIIFLVFHT